MTKYKIPLFILMVSTAWADASEDVVLTWERATQRLFDGSPRLNISPNEIGERKGIQIEAEALPNPIAGYSVENVLGNRKWRGWHAAESRYEIAQLIELGGKRGYRSQGAGYLVCAAEAEYQAETIRALNQLTKLFLDAAAAQELLKLANQQLTTSEKAFKTVKSKVDEGRSSIIQQNKAEIGFMSTKILADKAQVDWAIAKEKLSLMWGESSPDFDSVEYPFYEIEQPELLETCQMEISNHPEWLQAEYEYLSSVQNLCLEKADKIPDLTVSFGYKTIQNEKLKGFIFGAAIPLSIFNQNQGNIQRARSESQKIEEISRELRLNLENKLLSRHKEMVRAYNEVELIRNTILKAADKAFNFSKEGYEKGKFEYLDMLDSQKTLFEVQEQYIQALLNYHRSKTDIKYLNSEDE